MRLLSERHGEDAPKSLVQDAVEELKTFSRNTNDNFLAVVTSYLTSDIAKANSIGETFERGTLPSLAGESNRNNRETIDTAPIARTGHFTYALLDLVQQNLRTLCKPSLGMDFKAVTDTVLAVAMNSTHSYLRLKTLEVLLKIGQLDNVGLTKVETYIEQSLKEEIRSARFKQIRGKWTDVKQREQDMANFKAQLEAITVFSLHYRRVNLNTSICSYGVLIYRRKQYHLTRSKR